VGRLILFHLPDASDVLRHHVGGLTADGLMLMIDFDVGSVRSEPSVPFFDAARDWAIKRSDRPKRIRSLALSLGCCCATLV
jgi:hypothetical protein